MNWYKIAQFVPIAIISYNHTYNELGISFNGGPTYTYYYVNPYWHNKIRVLLGHKNYKAAEKILKAFGKYAPQHAEPHEPEQQPSSPQKPQQQQFPFMGSSWFGQILTAQIWDTQNDDSFEDSIKAMYELEYKLHAFKNFKWRGNPERLQNIATKLEEELWEVANKVQEPLLSTFRTWLRNHALLDPATWAQQRIDPYGSGFVSSYDAEETLEGIIAEYLRYQNGGQMPFYGSPRGMPNTDQIFSEMLNKALEQEEKFQSLQGIKATIQEGVRERLVEELYHDEFEQFGINQRGEPFQTEEEAEAYIEEMVENVDTADHAYDGGKEYILSILEGTGQMKNFLIELNQYLVFPLWMDYWSGMGIEATRELVQDAYDRMENASSLNDYIQSINHAFDVTHQSGDMIEYLDRYYDSDYDEGIDVDAVRTMLKSLSSGEYVPEWHKQLRHIGISVPRAATRTFLSHA